MTNTMKMMAGAALSLVLVACAGEEFEVAGMNQQEAGQAGAAGRPSPIVVGGRAGEAGTGQSGGQAGGGEAGEAGKAQAGEAGAGQAGSPAGQAGQVEAGQGGEAGAPGGAGQGGQPEAGQAGAPGGQAGAGQAGSEAGKAGEAGEAGAPVAGQAGAGQAGQAGAGQAGVAGSPQAGTGGQAGQSPVCVFDDRRCLGTQPQVCQGDGQWSDNGGDCSYSCGGELALCQCEAPAGRFTKTSHMYAINGDNGYMAEVYDTETKLTWLNAESTQMTTFTYADTFCKVNGRRLPTRAEVRKVQLGQFPQTVCDDNWPEPFIHHIDRVWTSDDQAQVPGARWTIHTTTAQEKLAAEGDKAGFRCVTDAF